MKTKKYYLLFLMFLFANLYFVKGQTKENLQNYLQIAAKNNIGLKSYFTNYLAAMEKVPQVGALPDPKVAFSYFIKPIETRIGPQKWKATISQTFPWFGLLKAKEDVATNFAKIKYETFKNAKSNLFYEVKDMYYNYYYLQQSINIAKKNIEILNTFKNIALVKIEAGKATIVDELRIELEINDLKNKLTLFQDTKNSLKTNFNNLLNRDVNAIILVPINLWQEDLLINESDIIEEIYNNNISLKSIDKKIQAFNYQKTVAKKLGLPKITIGVGYINVSENPLSNVNNNGKDAYFPSVGLTIPIYRKKYKAMVKEASLLQEKAELDKKEQKNNLSTINKKVIKDYKDSNRRITLNTKQIHIAKKTLDVLLVSYSTDAKNFEEVLRMERKLLKYELAYQKAISDKNSTIAFINYLLGN